MKVDFGEESGEEKKKKREGGREEEEQIKRESLGVRWPEAPRHGYSCGEL